MSDTPTAADTQPKRSPKERYLEQVIEEDNASKGEGELREE
jgi:hypothetical protein